MDISDSCSHFTKQAMYQLAVVESDRRPAKAASPTNPAAGRRNKSRTRKATVDGSCNDGLATSFTSNVAGPQRAPRTPDFTPDAETVSPRAAKSRRPQRKPQTAALPSILATKSAPHAVRATTLSPVPVGSGGRLPQLGASPALAALSQSPPPSRALKPTPMSPAAVASKGSHTGGGIGEAKSVAARMVRTWGSRTPGPTKRHRATAGAAAGTPPAGGNSTALVVATSAGTLDEPTETFHRRHFVAKQQAAIVALQEERDSEERRVAAQRRAAKERSARDKAAKFDAEMASYERREQRMEQQLRDLDAEYWRSLETVDVSRPEIDSHLGSEHRRMLFPVGTAVRLAEPAVVRCAFAADNVMLPSDVERLLDQDVTAVEGFVERTSGPHITVRFFEPRSFVAGFPVAALVPASADAFDFPVVVDKSGAPLQLTHGAEVIVECVGDAAHVTVRASYLVPQLHAAKDLALITGTTGNAHLIGMSAVVDGSLGTAVVPIAAADDSVKRAAASRMERALKLSSGGGAGAVAGGGGASGSWGSDEDSPTMNRRGTVFSGEFSSPGDDDDGDGFASASVTVAGAPAAELREEGVWIDTFESVDASVAAVDGGQPSPSVAHCTGATPGAAFISCAGACVIAPCFVPLKHVKPARRDSRVRGSFKSAGALSRAASMTAKPKLSLASRIGKALGMKNAPTRGAAVNDSERRVVSVELRYLVDGTRFMHVPTVPTTLAATPYFSMPLSLPSCVVPPDADPADLVHLRLAGASNLTRLSGPATGLFVSSPETACLKAAAANAIGVSIPNPAMRSQLVLGVMQTPTIFHGGIAAAGGCLTNTTVEDVSLSVVTEASTAAHRTDVFMAQLNPSTSLTAPDRGFAQKLIVVVDRRVLTSSGVVDAGCQHAVIAGIRDIAQRMDPNRDKLQIVVVDTAARTMSTARRSTAATHGLHAQHGGGISTTRSTASHRSARSAHSLSTSSAQPSVTPPTVTPTAAAGVTAGRPEDDDSRLALRLARPTGHVCAAIDDLLAAAGVTDSAAASNGSTSGDGSPLQSPSGAPISRVGSSGVAPAITFSLDKSSAPVGEGGIGRAWQAARPDDDDDDDEDAESTPLIEDLFTTLPTASLADAVLVAIDAVNEPDQVDALEGAGGGANASMLSATNFGGGGGQRSVASMGGQNKSNAKLRSLATLASLGNVAAPTPAIAEVVVISGSAPAIDTESDPATGWRSLLGAVTTTAKQRNTRLHVLGFQGPNVASGMSQHAPAVVEAAAGFTRGTSAIISMTDTARGSRIHDFFNALCRIVVANIELQFPQQRSLEVYGGLRDLRAGRPLLLSGRCVHAGAGGDLSSDMVTLLATAATGRPLKKRQAVAKTSLPFTRLLALRRLQHCAGALLLDCFRRGHDAVSRLLQGPRDRDATDADEKGLPTTPDDAETAMAIIAESCQLGVPFVLTTRHATTLVMHQHTRPNDPSLNPLAVAADRRPALPFLVGSTPASASPPPGWQSWAAYLADKLKADMTECGVCSPLLYPTRSALRDAAAGDDTGSPTHPAWVVAMGRFAAMRAGSDAALRTVVATEAQQRNVLVREEARLRLETAHVQSQRALEIALGAVHVKKGITSLEEGVRRSHEDLIAEEHDAWSQFLAAAAQVRGQLGRAHRFADEERLRLVYVEADDRAAIARDHDDLSRAARWAFHANLAVTPDHVTSFVDTAHRFLHDADATAFIAAALGMWTSSKPAASSLGMHGGADLCKALLDAYASTHADISSSTCIAITNLASLQTNHGSIEALQLDAGVRQALACHPRSRTTQAAALACLGKLCSISRAARTAMIGRGDASSAIHVILGAIERLGVENRRVLESGVTTLISVAEDPNGATAIHYLGGPETVGTAISLARARRDGASNASSGAKRKSADEKILCLYFSLVKRCATCSKEARAGLVAAGTAARFTRAVLMDLQLSNTTHGKALRCAERLCGNIGDKAGQAAGSVIGDALEYFVRHYDGARTSETNLHLAHRLFCRMSLAELREPPPVDPALAPFYHPWDALTIHPEAADAARAAKRVPTIPAIYGERVRGTVETAVGTSAFVGRLVRHESVLAAVQAAMPNDPDDHEVERAVHDASSVYEALLQLHVNDVACSTNVQGPDRLRCLGASVNITAKWHVVLFEAPPRPLRSVLQAIRKGTAAPLSIGTWTRTASAVFRLCAGYEHTGRPHGWIADDNIFCDGSNTTEWRPVLGPPSPVSMDIVRGVPPTPLVDAAALEAHASDLAVRGSEVDRAGALGVLRAMLGFDPVAVERAVVEQRRQREEPLDGEAASGEVAEAQSDAMAAAEAKLPDALRRMVFGSSDDDQLLITEASGTGPCPTTTSFGDVAAALDEWMNRHKELHGMLIAPTTTA